MTPVLALERGSAGEKRHIDEPELAGTRHEQLP